MTLVIMAAGMGSRFGGLKQIEPIDEYGNFIIDYSIYDAIKEGFTKVVFIIKKENYDIFRETVGKRVEKYIEVEYVFLEAFFPFENRDLTTLPSQLNNSSSKISLHLLDRWYHSTGNCFGLNGNENLKAVYSP